jgi:hypothetical protein
MLVSCSAGVVRSRVLAGVAVLVLAIAGCRSGADQRTLFVLLTDNQLLRVSRDGEVLTRARLGSAPRFSSYGGQLAASPDRRTVYALVRGQRQHVAAIDRDGAVRKRHALPGKVTWRRLAVGPKTGRLYLAGNVPGRRRNQLGDVELGVRLLVLSPDGDRLSQERIRDAQGRDWSVIWLTVAEDESSVIVAYHGSDTTGADVVRLDPIRKCRDTTPEWGACLARNHGRAQWINDEILAATGEPELAILGASGQLVRELDTGLRDLHLMEFIVAGDVAYAFGNCVQGTGLARVPLERGSARTLVRDVCGDTAALLDEFMLVLARRSDDELAPVTGRRSDAALVFVDLKAQKVENSVRLPEDPADVLAVG